MSAKDSDPTTPTGALSPRRAFGVAGVQMRSAPWDASANLATIERLVTSLARGMPWVRMVVFHELAVPGAVQLDRTPDAAELQALEQPIPGPHTDRLGALAAKTGLWLVPGSLYERDGAEVFNTAVAISPTGEIVAKYRKIFPWYPYEARTAAGRDFCVFDVPEVGRFGLSICYDMWFPETIRTLAWMGAEVIVHPTLTTTSDRELEVVLSRANAITNQCYFLDVNGIGPWGGGTSTFVDPDGRVLQTAGTDQAVLTELLDLDRVRRARELGTLGLTQTLKQLRDTGIRFPPYEGDVADGAVFDDLGPLGHGSVRNR